MLKWSAFPLKHATGNTMSEFIAENRGADAITRPNWSAVFSVAFCVACLIIVEFLPVSLLTPMAQDLGISEGVAGQSVTVTAFVAMFASLFITQTIQATDRRYVVILFAVLLTLSCLLVSFANSFSLLLIGRACLGLALGGFWAMSASLTMRLVPPRTVPKALSVIFGAVSIALVIAAPLGSFLGELIGWRNVFNAAAVMGVLCIFWIIKSLPSLPGEPSHQKQNTFRLLQRPGVMAGMIAIFMSFAGQFAFFTYIRPVYMNLAGFGVDGLTLVLLSFGIASFIGTSLSSFILKRSVKLALAGAPLILAVSAFVFPMAGYSKKIKTVAQIKEGATVAIPNDPTNLGRALLLLQKEKLITLKEGKGLLPTALDITDNPRHLQIMELEGAQLPRVLDDPKVDVAIISTTYIQQTGLSPVHDSVFIEDKNSPYVNILVAREDNKNAENVKEFLQSYQSPEVAKAAETIFNGGAVPGW